MKSPAVLLAVLVCLGAGTIRSGANRKFSESDADIRRKRSQPHDACRAI